MSTSKCYIVLCLFCFLPATRDALNHQYAETKTWWAKQIMPDFYSAGRLSPRQIKHASEVGFKSIFGNYNHTETENFGDEELPTTYVCKQIADRLGIEFDIYEELYWSTIQGVEYFVNKMNEMKQPTLVYCDTAYSATAIILLGLMYQTQKDASFEPKIYSVDFYQIGRAHGFDFDADECLNELVSKITGEKEVKLRTESTIDEVMFWREYWYAKYVSLNWFSAGQISDQHLPPVFGAGYKAIVNVRKGLPIDPSTLPNSDDETEAKNGDSPQSKGRLSEIQLDPNHPNDYSCISLATDKNYESGVPDEFVGDTGYSEQLEKEAWNGGQKKVMPYYHIPTDAVTTELFHQYVNTLEEASSHGAVIIHCDNGYRASAWAVLADGYFNCKNATWALEQASYMGYHYGQDDPAYKAIVDVLSSSNPNCGHQCAVP